MARDPFDLSVNPANKEKLGMSTSTNNKRISGHSAFLSCMALRYVRVAIIALAAVSFAAGFAQGDADNATYAALTDGGLGPAVYSFAQFDDNQGHALYIGGTFRDSSSGDSYIARWQGCDEG